MVFKVRRNTVFTNTVLEQGTRSVDAPSIRSVARYFVASVDPDGTARVNAVIDGASVLDDVVDPTVRRSIDADVVALRGLHGSWRMTPAGRISEISVQAPNGSRSRTGIASLAETARDNGVVFPDVPVGIGATWQMTSQLVAGGVTWDRTVTYRLKAVTDAAATVDVQIVMRAGSQALSVEPNASTRLTSATNDVNAELVVPLHGLIATATAQGTSEMNLLIVNGHLRISSTVRSEIISSVRRLVSPAEAGGGDETNTGE